MPTPSYMIDCPVCGLQAWAVQAKTNETIVITCTGCEDGKQSFDLAGETSGSECPKCSTTTWSVAEHTEDHLMITCENCGTTSEAWLRTT